MYCCLRGCKSIFKPKSAGGVSFHRIPPIGSPLRKKWLDFITKHNGKNELRTFKNCCLCSKHFTPDCLLVSSRVTRLQRNAVPTIVGSGAVPCLCTVTGSKSDATTPKKVPKAKSNVLPTAANIPTTKLVKTAPTLVISPLTDRSICSDNDIRSGLRFLSVHVSSNNEVDCDENTKTTSSLTATELDDHGYQILQNEDDQNSDCEHSSDVEFLSDDDSQMNCEPQNERVCQSSVKTQKGRIVKKPKKYDALILKSLLSQPQKAIRNIDLDYDCKLKTTAELKKEIRELENTLARVSKLAKIRARKLKTLCTRNSRLAKSIENIKAKLKKHMQKEDINN